MQRKPLIIGVLVLIILAIFGVVEFRKVTIGTPPPEPLLITVTSPKADKIIQSPLTVTGQARGTWYFEASFPLEVVDENGNSLGRSHAEAQGDWMTENLVPFKGTITFNVPTSTERGKVIFKKDNPSGLPEKDAQIEIPVRFK